MNLQLKRPIISQTFIHLYYQSHGSINLKLLGRGGGGCGLCLLINFFLNIAKQLRRCLLYILLKLGVTLGASTAKCENSFCFENYHARSQAINETQYFKLAKNLLPYKISFNRQNSIYFSAPSLSACAPPLRWL